MMSWKTKTLLAFGAYAGALTMYYGLPKLSAFLQHRSKKWNTLEKEISQVEEPCVIAKTYEIRPEEKCIMFEDIFNKRSVVQEKESKEKSDMGDAVEDMTSGEIEKTPKWWASESHESDYVAECQAVLDNHDRAVPDTNDKSEMYTDQFKVLRTLGSGAFGTVELVMHIKTQALAAIKHLDKNSPKFNWRNADLEISALQELRHQHVCWMYQFVETSDQMHIILEFCAQGSLHDNIMKYNGFSEKEARRVFRQILSALAFMHSKGYVHQDLTPKNIMMDQNKNIKLIDFGLCVKPKGGLNTLLIEFCGTFNYMAPEVLAQIPHFGAPADVWSFGVILYNMVCFMFPFYIEEPVENYAALHRKIMSSAFYVPKYISHECKTLLDEMLQVVPARRITVERLLFHPWVNKGYEHCVEWQSTHQTQHMLNIDQQCGAKLNGCEGFPLQGPHQQIAPAVLCR